jgi:fumarate reductase subunit C
MRQPARVTVGTAVHPRKSRWPARLDLLQSLSGLALGAFIVVHLCLDAAILVGDDAATAVARFFEGAYILPEPQPWIVSIVVAGVFALLLVHAVLAMRKFPANYGEYRSFADHRRRFVHGDTRLWWLQVLTGLAIMFVLPVHLYAMLVAPGDIGPHESAARIWSGAMWPLYLALLAAVVPHAAIGLYRLAVKWDWLPGADAGAGRTRARIAAALLIVALLALGLASLGKYMKRGYEQAVAAATERR